MLLRCVRKMNLSFIPHILNILAISKIFLPLITPRVQLFRLLGVAVVGWADVKDDTFMIINEIIKGYYSFNSYIFVLEQNISAWMSF